MILTLNQSEFIFKQLSIRNSCRNLIRPPETYNSYYWQKQFLFKKALKSIQTDSMSTQKTQKLQKPPNLPQLLIESLNISYQENIQISEPITIEDKSQAINKFLYNQYNSSQCYYYLQLANKIVEKSRSSIYIHYQDILSLDDIQLYFQRFYPKNENSDKLKRLTEYYQFHHDVPRIFMQPIQELINNYHDQMRRIDYKRIMRMFNQEGSNQKLTYPSLENLNRKTDEKPKINNEYKNQQLRKQQEGRNQELVEDTDNLSEFQAESIGISDAQVELKTPSHNQEKGQKILKRQQGEADQLVTQKYQTINSKSNISNTLNELNNQLKSIIIFGDSNTDSIVTFIENNSQNVNKQGKNLNNFIEFLNRVSQKEDIKDMISNQDFDSLNNREELLFIENQTRKRTPNIYCDDKEQNDVFDVISHNQDGPIIQNKSNRNNILIQRAQQQRFSEVVTKMQESNHQTPMIEKMTHQEKNDLKQISSEIFKNTKESNILNNRDRKSLVQSQFENKHQEFTSNLQNQQRESIGSYINVLCHPVTKKSIDQKQEQILKSIGTAALLQRQLERNREKLSTQKKNPSIVSQVSLQQIKPQITQETRIDPKLVNQKLNYDQMKECVNSKSSERVGSDNQIDPNNKLINEWIAQRFSNNDKTNGNDPTQVIRSFVQQNLLKTKNPALIKSKVLQSTMLSQNHPQLVSHQSSSNLHSNLTENSENQFNIYTLANRLLDNESNSQRNERSQINNETQKNKLLIQSGSLVLVKDNIQDKNRTQRTPNQGNPYLITSSSKNKYDIRPSNQRENNIQNFSYQSSSKKQRDHNTILINNNISSTKEDEQIFNQRHNTDSNDERINFNSQTNIAPPDSGFQNQNNSKIFNELVQNPQIQSAFSSNGYLLDTNNLQNMILFDTKRSEIKKKNRSIDLNQVQKDRNKIELNNLSPYYRIPQKTRNSTALIGMEDFSVRDGQMSTKSDFQRFRNMKQKNLSSENIRSYQINNQTDLVPNQNVQNLGAMLNLKLDRSATNQKLSFEYYDRFNNITDQEKPRQNGSMTHRNFSMSRGILRGSSGVAGTDQTKTEQSFNNSITTSTSPPKTIKHHKPSKSQPKIINRGYKILLDMIKEKPSQKVDDLLNSADLWNGLSKANDSKIISKLMRESFEKKSNQPVSSNRDIIIKEQQSHQRNNTHATNLNFLSPYRQSNSPQPSINFNDYLENLQALTLPSKKNNGYSPDHFRNFQNEMPNKIYSDKIIENSNQRFHKDFQKIKETIKRQKSDQTQIFKQNNISIQ